MGLLDNPDTASQHPEATEGKTPSARALTDRQHADEWEQGEHRRTSTPPGFRHVFGLYPTSTGARFCFLEIDDATYKPFRALADKSGFSVGEEIASVMERRGLTIDRLLKGGR